MQPTQPSVSEPTSTSTFTTKLLSTTSSPPTRGSYITTRPTLSPEEKERIRVEFYAAYDVMTGVRIAATLGGFFALMVFLVVYKSRSKSHKDLKDPDLAAVAAAAVAEAEEEERREIEAALEATAYYNYAGHHRSERGARRSLGNMSVPAMGWTRPPRFSSIGGGYSSLLAPPRRLSQQYGKSLPGSALRFEYQEPCLEGYGDELGDELIDVIDEDSICAGPSGYCQFLTVPQDSRRSSNITCSSSDSSYLERRGSAVVLGLTPAPAYHSKQQGVGHVSRRRSSAANYQDGSYWDFYYPIDIQVIQATPNPSPCQSERNIYDTVRNYPCGSELLSTDSYQNQNRNNFTSRGGVLERQNSFSNSVLPEGTCTRRMAPLASIGSCGISLSVDYQDSDLRSLDSDSVFVEDYADTDEDLEEFSSDSDEIINSGVTRSKLEQQPSKDDDYNTSNIELTELTVNPSFENNSQDCSTTVSAQIETDLSFRSNCRPQLPLPEEAMVPKDEDLQKVQAVVENTDDANRVESNVCNLELPIMNREDPRESEGRRWSQETLF